MTDYDKVLGYWLHLRPYVWVEDKNPLNCRRLYIPYKNELIFWYKDNESSGQRTKYTEKLAKKAPEFSRINIYGGVFQSKACQWASRYFQIYNEERDGPFKNLEIRVNGEPFKKRFPPFKPINLLKVPKGREKLR